MSGPLAFMGFFTGCRAVCRRQKISTQYLLWSGIFTALITAIYLPKRLRPGLKQETTLRFVCRKEGADRRRALVPEILIPVLVVIATLHPLNLFIEAQTGNDSAAGDYAPAGAAGFRL